MEHRLFLFRTRLNGNPYTIVIPPPNVTGMLHMGHMLNNTLQDVLVRRARMQGKNACWVPGTDHASIATEAKVVAKLKAEGIEKSSLSREEFLRHAWDWKEKYGGVILQQLRKLGASCDWERTCFTMDEARTESVLRVFCDLYEKGLIYPCFCTRAQLHAADAPNRGDDTPVYGGACARLSAEEIAEKMKTRRPAYRLRVPDETVAVRDRHYGLYAENLAHDCGDFILRRSDGLFGYQLAVVVDDALSGVIEIVRGHDILSSTPRQIYLQRLLGFETPEYAHIPLLEDAQGRRLAKRDGDTDLTALAKRFSREEILGMLAYSAGLLDENRPATMEELIDTFDWEKVRTEDMRLPLSF